MLLEIESVKIGTEDGAAATLRGQRVAPSHSRCATGLFMNISGRSNCVYDAVADRGLSRHDVRPSAMVWCPIRRYAMGYNAIQDDIRERQESRCRQAARPT